MRNNNRNGIKPYYGFSQSQESSNSNGNHPKIDLYKCIAQYNKYTQTPEHKKQEEVLRNFLQFMQNKVLFVFGPSGCGKHMLVQNFLKKYQIPYQKRAQQVVYDPNYLTDNQNQNQYKIIKGIKEQLYQSLSSQNNQILKVEIYEDFPIPNLETTSKESEAVKNFRTYFFKQVSNSNVKIIFILNSEIYNRYYIIPKDYPKGLGEITLKSYTNTDIKAITKAFINQYPVFQSIWNNKDTMEYILQVSNGDIRKVFLNLYKELLNKKNLNPIAYMGKNQKAQYKLKLKNEQKFQIFHLLGKYLYAKRYDIYQKTDRFFTKQELIKEDPPFYFDPVNMYLKSGVPLSTFTDLLFENYPARINTIQDAKNISDLFTHLDSCFPQFITNKRVDSLSEQTQVQYIFQLTWGIILKNKSSAALSKAFGSFRKSEFNHVMKDRQNKKELLRRYFPFSNLSSLVHWGLIVKNSRTTKSYLISGIIKKRSRMSISLKDDNQKQINEYQEQEILSKELAADPNQFIKNYNEKKKQNQKKALIEREIEGEELDSSDIDDS